MAQVYYKRLSNQIDKGQFDALLARLPAIKREQLLRRKPAVRAPSLALYALLDEVLAGHSGFPPLEALAFDARGWPHWPDASHWLSLSHSRHWLALALCDTGPVGVDVEEVRGQRAVDFARYFSREERDWAGEDPQRFLTLWTAREAACKTLGAGLSEVAEWRYDPESGRLSHPDKSDLWAGFHSPGDGALVAVTAGNPPDPKAFRRFGG